MTSELRILQTGFEKVSNINLGARSSRRALLAALSAVSVALVGSGNVAAAPLNEVDTQLANTQRAGSGLESTGSLLNRLLRGSPRVARATTAGPAVEAVAGANCGNEGDTNISVPDFDFCPRPDQALIYGTSIIYKETNGALGFQKEGQVVNGQTVKGDKVTGLHIGATYLMRNADNHAESYEVVVNAKGEISRTVKLADGKEIEQTVFVFTANPSTTPHKAENGRAGAKVEFIRHGAYDIGTKQYREADPVSIVSALGCTILHAEVRLEEKFLGPEIKPTPVTEAPKPPVVIPPAQLPRSGGGADDAPSTDLRSNPLVTPWPGQEGR